MGILIYRFIMSWSNIVKKSKNNVENKDITNNKLKKKHNVLVTNSDYYKPTPEENFDFFQGGELFDYICDVKHDNEKYNSLLLKHCCAGELYEFFKQFINIEEYDNSSD